MLMRLHIIGLAILAGLSIACAGGSGPIQPGLQDGSKGPEAYKPVQAGNNTLIMGAWDVTVDPMNGKVEIAEVRSLEKHFDVSFFLIPPKCYNCFLAKNLAYEPSTQVVTVDIGFRNPTNLTGFDVRGIITEFGNMELRNPDGFIDLFSPTPGKLNPFVAYDTGVGQREFQGQSVHYETLQIYDPNFPKFAKFKYIVEASYPTNCREPYHVSFWDVSGDLYSDGSNTQQVRLIVHDWQNDVSTVSADLSPIGGDVIALTPDGTIPDGWAGTVACAAGTLVGDYRIKVWGTSAPPTDQIDSMYNYITLTVGEPPEPGIEVFGPEERITTSSGESFIWPRHAIAVTSDGIPHAVWVDNSPDPESNIFHVYYSMRVGGVWTAPIQIDSAAGQAVYATIAADNNDVLHIVWEDEHDHVLGSDIYYASSADNFATETLLVNGADGFRNVHPKIVAGDDGTLHIAWHSMQFIDVGDYEYDLWYTKRPAGETTWDTATSIVSEKDVAETFPSIAPADNGAAYIAFQSDKVEPHVINFTENTSGSFAGPFQVTAGKVYQPAIDVTPDGNIVVAYQDSLDGTFSEIYTRLSADGGHVWTNAQVVSTSQDRYQIAPDIECTSEGDVHVAWHEEDDQGRPGKVYYREFVKLLAGWQDIIEIVGENGMGGFTSMDGDSNGHIHVVYELMTPADPPAKDNYEIWYRSSVP